MLFADLPVWIQDVLRDLSRDGYIYIGRTGVGLSHAFRNGSVGVLHPPCIFNSPGPADPRTECMSQGTIRAIETTAQYHELSYRLLLEQIAILGPKYVAYEKIQELMQQSPILHTLKEER